MTSAIVDSGHVTVAGAWFEFGIVPVLDQRRRCWWPVSSRGAHATAPGVIPQCAAAGADTGKRNRGRRGRYERREGNAVLPSRHLSRPVAQPNALRTTARDEPGPEIATSRSLGCLVRRPLLAATHICWASVDASGRPCVRARARSQSTARSFYVAAVISSAGRNSGQKTMNQRASPSISSLFWPLLARLAGEAHPAAAAAGAPA